ncbi:MAG: PAS domain-containing protein [Blastocatellia bacterium]
MSLLMERFAPILFGLALLFLTIIDVLIYRSLLNTQHALNWETHSREVRYRLERTESSLLEAETSARGFVLFVRRDFIDSFRAGADVFRAQLVELLTLMADNPTQQERLRRLQTLGEKKIAVSQKYIDLQRTNDATRMQAELQLGEGQNLMSQIRPVIDELRQEEARLFAARQEAAQTQVYRTLFVLLTGSTLAMTSLIIAGLAVLRQLKHRRQAEAALAKAHAQLAEQVEEQAKDLSKTSDELRLENIRRALAEKKEREQREWWRVTLNSLGDCVITTDTEGKINFINQTAQEVTQWGSEEVVGLPLEQVFHIVNETSLQPVENPITKVLREGVTVGLANHTSLITKGGRYLPIDDSGAPIRDDDGSIIGAVLVFRDFSQQRQAEGQLRESELFNRSIFENSPDCVKILELNGTLHSMNANGRRLMDIDDIANFAGKPWVEIWPPESRDGACQALQIALQGQTANFQGFCPTAKGTPKWWDVSIAPILNAENKPVRLIATSRDITERKTQETALRLSEIRFRTLTETIPQLVWTCQPDGQCSYLSQRWMEYTGTALEQNLGYGWLAAVHPDDAAQTQEVWQQAVATATPYQTEFRLRCADGSYRWQLARAVRVTDDNGATLKWFGTCTDLEDHKRAQVERLEMLRREQVLRAKAEDANRLKDEFVATISHELRTPLHAILGWARMLRGGTLDESTIRNAIDVIERSARHQSQLIDDLLDMSRIITGKLRLDIKPLVPAKFVQAALKAVLPAAQAKNITIQTDLDAHASTMTGDANRLQQVVWNLLSNAIKFTPQGGRINVSLMTDGADIVLTVTDTGQGIAPEFLPHIFDRFRQADAAITRKHGGLGLGLSIARQLVEMHGGVITAESKGKKQGAMFTVRLPVLSRPEISHANLKTNVTLPATTGTAALNGLFILAVDDEPDARQMLTHILTAYGATVITTDSAEAALTIIEQQQPDLLVSDIGMPENDGYVLIRRVRAAEQERIRRLPAIALTAFARPRDRMEALAAGFNHYVPKPVESTELVTVITALTKRLEIKKPS